MKLFDSELKVMEVLWEQGQKPAREIVDVLSDRIGWNKNTTYTETEQLIDKMYGGSSELFFSSFLKNRGISEEDAARLAKIIKEAD